MQPPKKLIEDDFLVDSETMKKFIPSEGRIITKKATLIKSGIF